MLSFKELDSSLMILISFTYIQVGCTADEFQCHSGYGCLDQSLLCDAQPQCLHGSDEFGCSGM